MDYDKKMHMNNVEFGDMPPQAFLLGLLSAFDNRYQAAADAFFKEITWKQFFAIICINLCKEAPTLNELSDVMGSSHQNVKQILLKLEKKGFVSFITDPNDKRKQRILVTDSCREFLEENDNPDVEVTLKKMLTDEQRKYIRPFYCQGGFNYEKMNGPSRLAMKMFVSALKKKKDQTEEEKIMTKMIATSYDISDIKYTEPIVEYLEKP